MKGLFLGCGVCMLGLVQWRIKFMFIHVCGTELDTLLVDEFHVVWGRSFSTYANFHEKLTFLTPLYAHVRVHIGVRNVSFSENFANVLNE